MNKISELVASLGSDRARIVLHNAMGCRTNFFWPQIASDMCRLWFSLSIVNRLYRFGLPGQKPDTVQTPFKHRSDNFDSYI